MSKAAIIDDRQNVIAIVEGGELVHLSKGSDVFHYDDFERRTDSMLLINKNGINRLVRCGKLREEQ